MVECCHELESDLFFPSKVPSMWKKFILIIMKKKVSNLNFMSFLLLLLTTWQLDIFKFTSQHWCPIWLSTDATGLPRYLENWEKSGNLKIDQKIREFHKID